LGLTSLTVDGSLSALNLPTKSGALVESVEPGTAAARAGIRGGSVSTTTEDGTVSVGGDVIVKVDGKDVSSSEGLAAYIEEKKPGDAITIELWRATGEGHYKKLVLKATLGQRPNSVPNPSTPEG
ncbi:MAG: PDZ domain-containing protein, partial [Solirubrobacteraceae bacterium]